MIIPPMTPLFVKKEKRDTALTVRLPRSALKKLKLISKKYNYSQSEVIESLINSHFDNNIELSGQKLSVKFEMDEHGLT